MKKLLLGLGLLLSISSFAGPSNECEEKIDLLINEQQLLVMYEYSLEAFEPLGAFSESDLLHLLEQIENTELNKNELKRFVLLNCINNL